MKTWNEWSVIKRLYGVFAMVGLVIAGQMVLSYMGQSRSQQTLESVLDVEYQHMRQVSEWQAYSTATTVRIMALNRSADPGIAAMFGPEIGPRIEVIDKYFADIKSWATAPEQRTVIADIENTSPVIMAALGEIAKARTAGDSAAALNAFENKFMPAVNQYHQGIDRFAEGQTRRLNTSIRDQQARQWQMFWAGNAVIAVVVLLGAVLILGLTQRIRKSLAESIRLAQEVASGDLRARARIQSGDEFGTLMKAMDGMAASLGGVVQHVRHSTDQISEASGEIAQGNRDLSERTERQASHLQQTAATMEQLTDAVRETAENASEAARLATQASQVAHRGGEVVGRVVDTMGKIEQSSRRIEEIISVIDGISFQTNILALNAAVEAARAGEQGRGFAVVAAEVRNLAQRSAAAAKEIKGLIDDSSLKVRDGGEQVQAAGHTMSELVNSVNQVSALIGEISQSASEQRVGIADVGKSVGEIDRSTQQNAALVEQAAAAAGSMSDQARQLDEAVKAFRV
jgi:methyl-accepting chemotaxis protein